MAITLKPIEQRTIAFTIRGISPLIQHQWDEKARKQMRDSKAGKKTKEREKCNPDAEFKAAMYRTPEGGYGLPAMAIKAAMINAAHKDIGIEKTLVKKSFFMPTAGVIPMECSEPIMREDYVKVGRGGTDLRYRPEFSEWSVRVVAQYDAGNLTPEDIINLVNRAGFGVGVGDWRPEKGGEHGRFEVDTTESVEG